MARRLSNRRIRSSVQSYRTRKRVLKILLAIIACGALGYGVYGDLLRMHTVEIIGNQHTSTDEIKKIAEETLAEHRWLILPKNNRLFFPTAEFKTKLFAAVPGVAKVEIEADGKTLQIKISDRKAMGVWCNGGEEGECFIFDTEGIVFRKSLDFAGSLFTSWTNPKQQITLSQKVDCLSLCTNPEYVSFLMSHKIYRAMIDGDTQLLASLHGYIIKAGSDPVLTMKRLMLMESKKIDLNSLQYIDVRFANKIYYK